MKCCQEVYKVDGMVGFYRGAFYPFFGSCLYRSTQYAVSDAVYNYFNDHPVMAKDIPYTGGIQGRVLLGGWCAGTFRACLECPFEYTKVRRQTG